jgi:hypothetical protein
MILHQGGRDMKGVKIVHGEKVEQPSERKEITVPPAVLSSYVGIYELAPGFSIAITLENGQLMEQATNQPKFPLFAESPTRFFLKPMRHIRLARYVGDAEIRSRTENMHGRRKSLEIHRGDRE